MHLYQDTEHSTTLTCPLVPSQSLYAPTLSPETTDLIFFYFYVFWYLASSSVLVRSSRD